MADLGKKYRCYKCGCKFYDLNKPSAVCPKCGEDQGNEETKKMLKRKRRRVFSRVRSEARPIPEDTSDASDQDKPEEDEYLLDMEDIVPEEKGDAKEKKKDLPED
ncbi:MAG: TIGR02300 family protein [Thermodesulfobacteriota bacterium]|nr:TIGR02300 family protein [Thermodesulfobacteriota bacterium]